jgi:hypothetical protein
MRNTKHPFMALMAGAALIAGITAARVSSAASAAQEAQAHDSGGAEVGTHFHAACELHGGVVDMTRSHHFETTFAEDGVRVYMYSADQKPMMFTKATGTASLVFSDGTKQEVPLVLRSPAEGERTVYFCPMHPAATQTEPGVCEKCGGMKLMAQNYMMASADLSQAKPGSLKVMIHLTGLRGDEPEVLLVRSYGEAMDHDEMGHHGMGHDRTDQHHAGQTDESARSGGMSDSMSEHSHH